jgi:hypothetical protein
MRIDLPAGPDWRATSDAYRVYLPFQDMNIHVQIHAGLRSAVYEATHGLARLFSHKKTIAVVEDVEPALETLLADFSADGYSIKRLNTADLADDAAFSAWYSPIASDLLFVLFANDDPVTGRLYNRAALNTGLGDKRVFRINVTHAVSHLAATAKVLERPQPFEVRILSLSPERALILAGERFRTNPIIAHLLPWFSVVEPLRVVTEDQAAKARDAVRSFEGAPPEGFKTYFSSDDDSRVFDRAVLYHPAINGSALIDELCAVLNIEPSAAGFEANFEATSPCRWSQPRVTDWLLSRGESEEVVRGLILIKSDLLNETLKHALSESAAKILVMQKG